MPGRRVARARRVAAIAATAACLACLVAWSLLAAWSARGARADEARHPPVGRFVDVDGARVHYLRRGAPATGARTLVFLHGAGTSLLDAVPALLPALADRFDVVAIDRPGHGYSARGAPSSASGWVDPLVQAGRVAGTLRALGVEGAVWIGHSWAGAVALAAVRDLPARDAAAAVTIAGVLYPWPGGTSSWPARVAAAPVLGAAFSRAFVAPVGRGALAPAVRAAFAPEAVPEDYLETTATVLSLRPAAFRHDAIDRTRLSGWLETAAPRWAAIARPVLTISGSADRVVPPGRHALRLLEALPAARSTLIAGAGHGLIHTRAERIAREVEAFVATLP